MRISDRSSDVCSSDLWERLFALYRQIPEYQQVNAGMSLEEFKTIFWWEYIHRLWGRLIGVVFVVPLAWFWWRGQIDRPLGKKLLAALALGSAQGALGWFKIGRASCRERVCRYV